MNLVKINQSNLSTASEELWRVLFPKIQYLEWKDQRLVELAFTQMVLAHGNDKRKSGDFYIVHPACACLTLASIGMDKNTLAACLLHDVPEDTAVSLKDLSCEFNSEIIYLVEGVARLSAVKYQGEERFAENLRRMFVAMSRDLRIIFIKLAERLHNLQTLKYVDPSKQHRIALESLEIYASIADRLGITMLKNEIEDTAFPFVYPDIHKSFISVSELEINRRQKIGERLIKKVKKSLEENHIKYIEVYGRAKKYYSLYKKITEKEKNLAEIFDLVAMRVITRDVENCYRILSHLQQIFDPIPEGFKDYIDRPKPNGYQSLHLRLMDNETGSPFEFQIRTPQMHQQAEYGVAAHYIYKADQQSTTLLNTKNLVWISELVDIGQKKLTAEQYLNRVKLDLFTDRIFVMTPGNDAIDLPAGSSALDFAYRIHEVIGHHATMAKVNHQIAKLGDKLNNGDVVEIITDKRQCPKADWLKLVTTSHATKHIRSFLKKQTTNDDLTKK